MAKGSHQGLIGLPQIIDRCYATVDAVMVGVAQDLVERLQEKNPVDHGPEVGTPRDWGVSRDHWIASVDTYTQGGITGKSPYIGGMEIELRTKSKGRFLSAPRSNDAGSHGFFDSRKNTNIVVSNDAPYMARLNSGWSKQAEAGWVDHIIDTVTSKWGLL